MAEGQIEYTGMMAQFWDLLRGDSAHWTDRFFYKEVVAQCGQPALDVGCGTGRLVLDFIADGIDIDGVDNSPEMLDFCREKGTKLGLQPTLYLQSMTALALPRQYQTILVPSGSLQILIEPNDVRAAMQRFFTHLLPGGTLVIAFYQLWTGGPVGPTAREEWMREVVRPEDGAILRRWSRSTDDLVRSATAKWWSANALCAPPAPVAIPKPRLGRSLWKPVSPISASPAPLPTNRPRREIHSLRCGGQNRLQCNNLTATHRISEYCGDIR